MYKFVYEVIANCDGCNEEKKTRKVDHLDIRHRKIEHHLCRRCDTSKLTTKKIYDRNTKLYGLGDPFGLKEGNRKFVILYDIEER